MAKRGITSEEYIRLAFQIGQANKRIENERQRQLHKDDATKSGATALEFALREVAETGGETQFAKPSKTMTRAEYSKLSKSVERVLKSEQLTEAGRQRIIEKTLGDVAPEFTKAEQKKLGDVFATNMWAKVREVAGKGASDQELETIKNMIKAGASRQAIIQVMSGYLKNQDSETLTDRANAWAERRGIEL